MEANPTNAYPAIVIGGSAGSIEPLVQIVSRFPADFSAYVFVVVHIPADAISNLPQILTRGGNVFAAHALDGAPLLPHRIIIAPPDTHITVAEGAMHVQSGAKENGHRPSIDVLFRSAAQSFGANSIGVLLSGTLDDGVDGLRAIRRGGGKTFVQDPDEALFRGMPDSAIKADAADVVVSADQIGEALCRDVVAMSQRSLASIPRDLITADERVEGSPSIFTCPDCGGTLWEFSADDDVRYRCRTGHAYSTGSMLSLQSENIEHGLWAAVRALEERTDLLRKLAIRANLRNDAPTAERFEGRAAVTKIDIDAIQQALNRVMHHARSEV